MPELTPKINGQAYAWVDLTVNIGGAIIAGITSIEYEETADVVNNYGAGKYPVSQSVGKSEFTASMTIDRAEYNALLRSAPGKSLIKIPSFDVIVSYLPEGSAPTTDIIKNCRFKTNKGGGSEGDSNIVVELELVPSHIEFDALG